MKKNLRHLVMLCTVCAGILLPLNAQSPAKAAPQGASAPQGAAAKIQGKLDWNRMEISSQVSVNLSGTGIRLPADRARAETMLEAEYTTHIYPLIKGIQVDSLTTVEDLVKRGELSLGGLPSFAEHAPPAFSPTLTSISANYTLPVVALTPGLTKRNRTRTHNEPIASVTANDYTGIIIIANDTLPVYGRKDDADLTPCLFPRVWDTSMNLIYGKNMVFPGVAESQGITHWAGTESIMTSSPHALDDSLVERVGTNPLRILAVSVFGVEPTDPVIDKEDALIILANENNRSLLLNGRVAIVIDSKKLRKTLP